MYYDIRKWWILELNLPDSVMECFVRIARAVIKNMVKVYTKQTIIRMTPLASDSVFTSGINSSRPILLAAMFSICKIKLKLNYVCVYSSFDK